MKRNFLKAVALGLCFGCIFTGCQSSESVSKEGLETNTVSEEATTMNNNEQDTEVKTDASKKAVLVVSFGTSYANTREATIGSVEKEIAETFPEYEQRRAFTSQTIINKLKERDGLEIDNVEDAVKKLIAEEYGTVVVQPTHVMNGEEYDEMIEIIKPYEKEFVSIQYGKPLLSSSEDYFEVADTLSKEIPQVDDKDCAVVFVGHGTEHFANSTYAALDYRFKDLGYDNVFIGTVEAYPDIEKVKKDVATYGAKKVVLCPLMIVAGDHANNDIGGDEEESWKTIFKKDGYEVEVVMKGLGEYDGIRKIFAEHCKTAIDKAENKEYSEKAE